MFSPTKYFELNSKIELTAFQARSVSGYLPEVGEIYPITCPLILPPPSFQVPFQIGMGGEEGWERSYSIHVVKRRLRCSPSKDLKRTLLWRWFHVFSPKITGELSPVINAGCLGLLPRPLEIWRLTLLLMSFYPPSDSPGWPSLSLRCICFMGNILCPDKCLIPNAPSRWQTESNLTFRPPGVRQVPVHCVPQNAEDTY